MICITHMAGLNADLALTSFSVTHRPFGICHCNISLTDLCCKKHLTSAGAGLNEPPSHLREGQAFSLNFLMTFFYSSPSSKIISMGPFTQFFLV